MDHNKLLKNRTITVLFLINIVLIIFILFTIFMATRDTRSTPSYVNEIVLSHQYISEIPDGVIINKKCDDGWYCLPFEDATGQLPKQEGESLALLKDPTDQVGPHTIIFYAKDHQIDKQFCGVANQPAFGISIFEEYGVNCNRLFEEIQ